MRAMIYGAGASGCYFGARLQHGGHDVTYVARGEHLNAMQQNGQQIESPSGNFHLEHVDATSDVADVSVGDLIFFGVKNYDVEKSVSEIRSLVGQTPSIITVQNGVSAQPIVARKFGAHRVLPGVVKLPASIKNPGVVTTPAEAEMGGITFGSYESGSSKQATKLRDEFANSGIPTILSEDIWRSLWEKFIPLSAFSATTVSSRKLLKDLIDETAMIARASHMTVPDNAGQMAFDFLMSVPANIHASMLDDLLRGKRIELDWLSGEVVRRGQELGITTPAHRFAYAVLSPYIDGRPEGSL